MTPLPLLREHVRLVPNSPGCYIIYLDDQPYYAGMSRTSIRTRLWAHATSQGSKMIRQMLAEGRTLYFEYYDVYPSEGTSMRDVARAELVFLLMHTGKLLPGNLKADGLSLFPDKENQRSGDALPPEGAPSEAASEETHRK
jgi:hypothetical protein